MLTSDIYYENLDKKFKNQLEKRVDKKLKILQKYLEKINKPLKITWKVNQFKHQLFSINVQLNLGHKEIIIEKKNNDLLKALEVVFNALKENLLIELKKIKEK
ncbi:hypothetical protein GYA19_06320 [Candidatus Beckwithbacteria bacterium]|nr:hypothetical protein [Candidatus Beckwithbacteria bacterium]